VAGAAGDDALTVLSADDEGSFFEGGHDGDASGLGGDAVGDALVGRAHELVKDFMGSFDALIEFLHVCCGCSNSHGHGQGRSGAECLNKLSHFMFLP